MDGKEASQLRLSNRVLRKALIRADKAYREAATPLHKLSDMEFGQRWREVMTEKRRRENPTQLFEGGR